MTQKRWKMRGLARYLGWQLWGALQGLRVRLSELPTFPWRLWNTLRGGKAGPQIDFIGPMESTWSIARVNRDLVTALLQRGWNIACFSASTRRSRLTRRLANAFTDSKLNRLLLPETDPGNQVLLKQYPDIFYRLRRRQIVFFGYSDLIQSSKMGKLNLAWVVFESAPQPWQVRLCRKVDRLLVPSHFVRGICIEAGLAREKIQVLPHCIDPNVYFPTPMEESKPTFQFLNVGLEHLKQGHSLLLRAYFEEFSSADNVELIIKTNPRDFVRGLQHESRPLEEMIASLQKEHPHKAPKVKLLREGIAHMPHLYQQSDCYVSPLYTNGFAMAVLESMACGRPAIVTRYGGLTDYCRDDNAYFIEVEKKIPAGRMQYHGGTSNSCQVALPSKESLKQQMRLAYTNRQGLAEKGIRAAETVKAQYTLDVIGEQLDQLLRGCRNQTGYLRSMRRVPFGTRG